MPILRFTTPFTSHSSCCCCSLWNLGLSTSKLRWDTSTCPTFSSRNLAWSKALPSTIKSSTSGTSSWQMSAARPHSWNCWRWPTLHRHVVRAHIRYAYEHKHTCIIFRITPTRAFVHPLHVQMRACCDISRCTLRHTQ